MPQVGKNNYGYDEKGKAAAAADSAKTGNPVVSTKKKKKKKEGPVERGRRLKKDRMSDEKSDRDEFYAQNPHSVLPSGEGWDGGSKGHMGGVLEPAAGRSYKEGGVVYSDARGAGKATRGTRYRS